MELSVAPRLLLDTVEAFLEQLRKQRADKLPKT
jgi:hypothetical protein